MAPANIIYYLFVGDRKSAIGGVTESRNVCWSARNNLVTWLFKKRYIGLLKNSQHFNFNPRGSCSFRSLAPLLFRGLLLPDAQPWPINCQALSLTRKGLSAPRLIVSISISILAELLVSLFAPWLFEDSFSRCAQPWPINRRVLRSARR